jgi:RNA polymerase-binding transcription factor DksA
MLDEKFVEERKKDLLERKRKLEEELSKIAYKDDGDYKPKFPSMGDKDEDNELEISEFDEAVDAEQKLGKMLSEIKKALTLIETGKYGWCDNCNQEIDPARLKAIPWATTCIKCDR